jgi:hypothetical protein
MFVQPIGCVLLQICNNVNVADIRNAAVKLTDEFFQQRLVLLANTTQQSQIPSTEDHVEKEEMKSVMRQLSTNITLVNDTLSKKLQWLAEDESKDHVSVFPVPGWCSNPATICSLFANTELLFESWMLFTISLPAPGQYMRPSHYL